MGAVFRGNAGSGGLGDAECIGHIALAAQEACGLAPALTINEQVYPQMSPDKIRAVIKELRGKEA